MWRRAFLGALVLLITSIVIAQPALAQSVTWHGDYYNNPNLSGQPTITRDDASIAFNWGTGSPGNGINVDNFSVRWAADVSLSPGTYRFYAQADDNIRIYFNFVTWAPVVDTFNTPSEVSQLVTGDVNVTQPGTYHIQVDYRELTDQAFAYVSFANLASNPSGPNFSSPSGPVNVPTGSWTAQYFSNPTLSGDPVAIITEASPSHQWGGGSPLPSVPVDNFSARWLSTQNLPAGSYTISAQADDGVRVWVNGALVIDQWHGANSQTYYANVTLPTGQSYFQVEYYEAQGNAYLNFAITQNSGSVNPTPVPNTPTGATATVTAYRLNVRALPDAVYGEIITRINQLETYAIVGRLSNNAWYLLNVNGTNGWVAGPFINVVNGANIPVVSPQGAPAAPTATGNVVTATPFTVVIRSGPSTSFNHLGLFPLNAVAPVVGRNSNNTWWQINLNGLYGWVSAQFAIISPTANIGSIPVTG